MNTEIPDNTIKEPAGWIYFDADCRFCRANRRCWGRVFESRGFVWVPLQTPGAAARLGCTGEALMAAMWLQTTDGQITKGVAAWIALGRHVWWLRPLAWLLGLPGVNTLAQAVYRWIARSRYCIAGRCRIDRPDSSCEEEALPCRKGKTP